MTAIIIIVIIVIIVIAIAVLRKEDKPHDYKSTFGNPSEFLSPWNEGFSVGNNAVTKRLSHSHLFVAGQTGSGKSSLISVPSIASLARGKSSIIIHDISSELWNHCSAFLASKGYSVLRVDFSNSTHSESFNPLLNCKSVGDIQKIAMMIVRNTLGESKGDPFWEQSSIMLISLMMRYLVFHSAPELRTLQNTRLLIEKFAVDGKAVDKLFAATQDEDLLLEYKNFLVTGEKTLMSIVATARTSLYLFADSQVCKTTATTTIDFSLLREKPIAIFVCSPIKDLEYLKPITAIFFQTLFNVVMSEIPHKKDRKIFFLIDEFAAYTFPNMTVTISNMRKYAGMCIIMQDEAALVSRYGQAEAKQIKTNCGIQCYLKGTPLHTANELSQIFGKYTYIDEKGVQRTRELMTPSEIHLSEDVLVLIGNNPPLKITAVPYFKNWRLQHLKKSRPFPITERNIIIPPRIKFE